MTSGLSSIDLAAADRIAAAFTALETELAAAGVPQEAREDVIVLLAARRRQDRIRPQLEARARRIVAQRAAAREEGIAGWRNGVGYVLTEAGLAAARGAR